MTIKTKRKLTPSFKFQVVVEALQNQERQTELARQYDIHPQLISNWKKQLLKQGPNVFAPANQDKQQDRKIENLEKIIGRQTIEIQFLKKVLSRLD